MPQHKVRDSVLVKLSGGRIDDGRFHVIYAWEVAEEGRWPRFGMVTSELGWGLPVTSESASIRRVNKLRSIAFAIWPEAIAQPSVKTIMKQAIGKKAP